MSPRLLAAAAGWAGTDAGRLLVVALVVAAAGLLAWAVILLVAPGPSSLEVALSPYSALPEPDAEARDGDRGLAETAVVQRAVEATARVVSKGGLLPRLEALLDQAHLPLRAPEVLFFDAALGGVASILALVLTRSLLVAAAVMAVAAAAPAAVLKLRAARRRGRFTSQLPDTLQLLAGSLRAGYSLLQGMESVAQEVDDPMGAELRRVLPEARLGRALEDSLDNVGERMGSPDFTWAVMAIRIQREVGGNLAELLSTVGETMIARERLHREVRALTAEGRISAIILGILPVGIGLALYLINPRYMNVLFHRTIGQAMIAGSAVLAAFGFWWMKKTIEVKV